MHAEKKQDQNFALTHTKSHVHAKLPVTVH